MVRLVGGRRCRFDQCVEQRAEVSAGFVQVGRRGTGFRGRNAIAEMLLFDDAIRELIISREPISRIKAAARANGTRFLREAAVDLVRAGVTDLKEINRVTFVA